MRGACRCRSGGDAAGADRGCGRREDILALVFIVAVAVLDGWAPAVFVAVFAVLSVQLWRRLRRSAFSSTSLYALSACALEAAALADDDLPGLVGATFAGSVAFYAANITFLTGVVALANGEPLALSRSVMSSRRLYRSR